MIPRFQKFLAYSLIVHLLLLFFLQWMPKKSESLSFVEPAPIWVDIKNRKLEIADILPPEKEEKPQEHRFVGMYDSRVDEETVSALPYSVGPAGSGAHAPLAHAPGSIDPKAVTHPQNQDNANMLDDFYPDFKKGAHTYLNILRFPEVQYFVVLKRIFKTTWNPLSPLRELAFNNQISRGNLEVVLGVSVDGKGNLTEAFVFRSSGIPRYDAEALRTIRASAPFTSPPNKFLAQDGLLRMSWTFTVYL